MIYQGPIKLSIKLMIDQGLIRSKCKTNNWPDPSIKLMIDQDPSATLMIDYYLIGFKCNIYNWSRLNKPQM